VVLSFVAEGSGHPAASAVDVADDAAGNLRQETHCGSRPDQRLLVAMAVMQDLCRSTSNRRRAARTGRPFLECNRSSCHRARLLLQRAAQKLRMIVADR